MASGREMNLFAEVTLLSSRKFVAIKPILMFKKKGIKCGLPHMITNAHYQLAANNHVEQGAIARYFCDAGYTPQSNIVYLIYFGGLFMFRVSNSILLQC